MGLAHPQTGQRTVALWLTSLQYQPARQVPIRSDGRNGSGKGGGILVRICQRGGRPVSAAVGDRLRQRHQSRHPWSVKSDRPDLADVVAAAQTDDAAHSAFRDARSRLVAALDRILLSGPAYDVLARAIVRARTGGRGATLGERRREAARLRQLRRRAVSANGRHADLSGEPRVANDYGLRSVREEIKMNRLVKRTVTEEVYTEPEQEDLDDAEGDDVEEDLKGGEADDERSPPPPRRRR
jgi:hypothetical protein